MRNKALSRRRQYIYSYMDVTKNAATLSTVDSNANVTARNVATMSAEINKPDFIELNRSIVEEYLKKKNGNKIARQFIKDLKHHNIYSHDETSLMPYTYSSKEVVNVKYNGEKLLVSLDQLYDLVDVEEKLLDDEKGVYGKFPTGLEILDRNGWTSVSRLIRKKRHRDLVRVKTAFGEDIVVTDNHPIIIGENVEDTISAIDGLGHKQYKYQGSLSWSDNGVVDLNKVCDGHIKERFDGYFTVRSKEGGCVHLCPNTVALTEELGYFVGFFVGDGNYNKNERYTIQITQKDRSVLEKLANIGIKYFNATPKISYDSSSDKFTLIFNSPALAIMMRDYFGIGEYAQRKTIPTNILETNKSFAKGVIWGLVDSDGTVRDGCVNIRLSSRAGINQLCWIMKDLGYTVGTSIQEATVGFEEQLKNGYTQNYTIWGIQSTVTSKELLSDYSFKAKSVVPNNKGLKYKDGWVNIVDVKTLQSGLFLNEQNEYIYDITTDTHSFICNNIWVHNCVAVSLYPFVLNGLKDLGGTSGPPQHAESFIGGLTNLLFLIAGQFAGACAVPETIPYLDHYLRIDYGEDYTEHLDDVIEAFGNRKETLRKKIEDLFQQFVYCINQPAAARGYQSPFTNVAYFDRGYFESLFEGFVFPDGDEPNYESTNKLQKMFIKWFNKERTKDVLTFPVETMNLLWDKDTQKYVDEEMADFTAEMWSEGHSFFMYNSDSADALSSCCRLKNAMESNEFSYTLGAGGVMTGSKKVITLNINRIVQDWYRKSHRSLFKYKGTLSEYIEEITNRVHKYLEAWNDYLWDLYNSDLLTVYKAGFIELDKQYLTIGFNGFIEGAEFLASQGNKTKYDGLKIRSDNEQYKQYTKDILVTIKNLNTAHRTEHLKFNTEQTPCENVGPKFYKWDKRDGYKVPENRNAYNSYFYPVEDESYNPIEKMYLQGTDFIGCLDGGSAYHCNLDSYLSKEQYRKMMDIAIQAGCSYYTYNIPNTICNECNYIDKRKLSCCPKCGSTNIDYATRIIGYLKRVSNFSEARQKEAAQRYYAPGMDNKK